jgi:hypothetical protein
VRFPSRRLLRVISALLGSLVLGLLATIILLSILRSDSVGAGGERVIVPVLMLPGLYVVKMILDSFSVLEVDEKGVGIRKAIGSVFLGWERIGSARYWEQIQMVQGAQSKEYFLELRGMDGARLLRLKSTYEPAAYDYLLRQARARNIRVDLG